jgi:mannose-6-phosphate isomerase
MTFRPFRLLPVFDRRPWGRQDLSPWFPPAAEPVGEVWFYHLNPTSLGPTLEQLIQAHGRAILGPRVDTPLFPVLAKFIFTADKLSVQVHPGDEYAWRREGQWGKIEVWYVLRADPGARLALGLREPIAAGRFRAAAQSGEIEQLLAWREIQPGDVYLIYPGTIHALGPGVVVAEIQQNSDLTYRIYDYGRPRPLHLEQAAEVAHLGPYPGCPPPIPLDHGWRRLAQTRYFAADLLHTAGTLDYQPDADRFHLLLVLEGSGRLQEESVVAGQCWFIPAGCEPFRIQTEQPLRLLRSFYPGPA